MEIVGVLAFLVWWSAMVWVLGYEYGKRRGRTTINNFSTETAHFNIMPGATLSTYKEAKESTSNG